MSKRNTISAVIRCAEINGWNVHTEEVPKARLTIFEFSRFTPAGRDFSFSVAMVEDDLYSLVRDVGDYHYCFDTDKEAYFGLDSNGHGRNGAPYRMRDVLDDMEAAYDMLTNLFVTLRDLEDGYQSYCQTTKKPDISVPDLSGSTNCK